MACGPETAEISPRIIIIIIIIIIVIYCSLGMQEREGQVLLPTSCESCRISARIILTASAFRSMSPLRLDTRQAKEFPFLRD